MPPEGFVKIINQYAKYSKIPIILSVIRTLVGTQNYQENIEFISNNELGSVENLSQDTCDKCGLPATVKDVEKGVVVCSKLHVTTKDPMSLKQVILKPESIVELLYRTLAQKFQIRQFEQLGTEYTPFGACGFEPVGIASIDDMQILFLASFKTLRLKDAAMLQGLIANTIYDSFILLIENIEENAEKFLAYNTGGIVQYVYFDELLRHNANLDEIAREISSGINAKTIKLHSYLKNELRNVQNIVTPEMFLSLMQFDSNLVNRSFIAATQGKMNELEDAVGNLFGALLPVTKLGYGISKQLKTKKIEAPDGIIQIPIRRTKSLELMFYDCKSVGTDEVGKSTKIVSQADEDQFSRYCQLFNSDKMNARLTAGILVAKSFSAKNMRNKVLQIRSKGGVPSDVKIVFFPLESLVKLYTRLTKERTKFGLHFESDAVYKLLGTNLDSDEDDKIKNDKNFQIFDELRKTNTNSVYVIESLVDLFFDHVYSLETAESQYIPFIINLSKRYSTG